MLGGIISAIGGLAGSYLNNKSAEKRQNEAYAREDFYNRNRIQLTVEDAKKAGIHPLAALGASSVGSIGTAVQPLGSSGVGDAVADGAAAIAKALPKETAKLEVENAQLRNEALRADIRKSDAETTRLLSDATSRSAVARVGDATRGGKEVMELKGFGGVMKKNPNWSDAQDVEDRYGNIVESVYGLGALVGDAYHNYGRWLGPSSWWKKGPTVHINKYKGKR